MFFCYLEDKIMKYEKSIHLLTYAQIFKYHIKYIF
jgi:hypothetical protein